MQIFLQRVNYLFSIKDKIPAQFHPYLIKHILKIKQHNHLRKVQVMKYINKKDCKFLV